MNLADAAPKAVITDVIYGASTVAVVLNLVMVAAWVLVGWRLRHRWWHATHSEVIAWLLLLFSQLVIHGEQALHAYVGYGASWQVSEHGLFFLVLWTTGVLTLAATAPWDGTARFMRTGRRRRQWSHPRPLWRFAPLVFLAGAALGVLLAP